MNLKEGIDMRIVNAIITLVVGIVAWFAGIKDSTIAPMPALLGIHILLMACFYCMLMVGVLMFESDSRSDFSGGMYR
jgi:hypothetical protein